MTSEMLYRDGKRENFISYISILTGNHIAHPCRFMDKWVRPRVVEVVIIPGSQVPKHSSGGERHHDVAWAIFCYPIFSSGGYPLDFQTYLGCSQLKIAVIQGDGVQAKARIASQITCK
jgi:hypothetical protein